MTPDVALFAIVATITAGCAVGVVLARSVIRAAVWLLGTLVGVSLVYFLLGAEFLGATQLIVYVGGTMVLVIFGSMLTAGGPFNVLPTRRLDWLFGGAMAATLFGVLVVVSLKLGQAPHTPTELPGTGALGLAFLGMQDDITPGRTTYLLPFEIVSIHLLVVLVGAAYLARAKQRKGAA